MKDKISGEFWIPKDKSKRIFVCLWELPNGRIFTNEEGTPLSAESREPHDFEVEEKMRLAAAHYGAKEGKPAWYAGRKVSNEEYAVIRQRMAEGKIPDPREERIRLEEGDFS